MAEVLSSYATVIKVDVILAGSTHRFANKDFYDPTNNYYKGTLLDFPSINTELSDLYYGVEQASTVTLRFANTDDGVDDTWDAIVAGEEIRDQWVRIRRHDPTNVGHLITQGGDHLITQSGLRFRVYQFEEELEFRGKIVNYKIGDEVEIIVEMRDDWILDTLLPQDVVTAAAPFTSTALDVGEVVNICFGRSRSVPLRNIQNDTGNDLYDYLIGYGPIADLWIDQANDIGVHRRDTIGLRMVTPSEYTFYNGSQATPYPGYAFLRFTTEQRDSGGAMCELWADVNGLLMDEVSVERNFAKVIKGLLSNTTWGLSDNVDTASFGAAAVALNAIGNLYCDGAITEQKQARDFLNDLLFPSRASIERGSDGEWEISIDGISASVMDLGDNDGFYNNAEIGDISITPANEALKTAVVQYDLNKLNESRPLKESSLAVHSSFGVVKTYALPFVVEDDTAELVLSYLKNRSLYSDRRTPVFVGMEGRDLSRGDVITLTKPRRSLTEVEFKIESIIKGGIGFDLQCREYSDSIYDDEVVAPPPGPPSKEIFVDGPRSWVGDTQLGDGTNYSGTVTLNLASGQGDCYIKGGTVDVTAWTCTGGFILGIDDSDSDRAKLFVGSTASSFMFWNGVAMAYQIGSGHALTVKGGGDINVDAGGDIVLTGDDVDPSEIRFVGNTYATTLSMTTLGDDLVFSSDYAQGYFKVEGNFQVKKIDNGILGGLIITEHLSASPAIGDTVARMLFKGYSDGAPQNLVNYGRIDVTIVDETKGTEDGKLEFYVVAAGGDIRSCMMSGSGLLVDGLAGGGDRYVYVNNSGFLIAGAAYP